MKKCPNCGSARYRKFIEERMLKRKCERCGFKNLRKLVKINDEWFLK